MKLNFKCAIVCTLILAVAGTVLAGNEFVKAKRPVPYKTIFNHDGTHVLTCESPYRIKGEPVDIEKIMSASFDELGGIGIDAVSFCPGLCWVPWWQSDVYSYEDHAQWYKQKFGTAPDVCYVHPSTLSGNGNGKKSDDIRQFVDPFISIGLKTARPESRVKKAHAMRYELPPPAHPIQMQSP